MNAKDVARYRALDGNHPDILLVNQINVSGLSGNDNIQIVGLSINSNLNGGFRCVVSLLAAMLLQKVERSAISLSLEILI